MDGWWTQGARTEEQKPKLRAVAYYRHSAMLGQENSVEIQQDNVRAFAAKHDLEIIQEFADRGKSGLNAEGRPAFTEMMEWVRTRDDFCLILVLDVSRWGRFQDTDLSAHYESLCTQHGKQVIYTHIGFTRDEDRLINQLRKSIDRYQSAETSRMLSKKVFEGAAKVAHQGYRPGGPPPYGTLRLMLNEQKQPDRVLQPGQRKAIQNGRVVLVPGDPAHVEVVQEIFLLFVERGFDERQVAGHLNAKKIPSPGGVRWSETSVQHILTNQQYAGAVVYNRTTQRLKTPRRLNPREEWIVTPDAYEPVVAAELFEAAQRIIEGRKRRYSREQMLERLRRLYERYNVVTSRLVRFDDECPSPATYAKRFGGLTGAFQAMFGDVLARIRDDVFQMISREARLIDEHDDFIVINQDFTVLIQPSVPVPDGYGAFWAFPEAGRTSRHLSCRLPGDQYRRRAEVLATSSFFCSEHIPHRMRLSGLPVCIQPWVGRMLHDCIDRKMPRDEFEQKWNERDCGALSSGLDAPAAWDRLDRISCVDGNTLDMHNLRAKLARSRPPVEVCMADGGFEGPILGTIHASKGREANDVYLFLSGDVPEDAVDEESRVVYVGATRAKQRLCVATPGRVYAKTLNDTGRVFSIERDQRSAKVEIGREHDVLESATVSMNLHESGEEALAIQDLIAERATQVSELCAVSEPDWKFQYRLKYADRMNWIGQLAEHVNWDMFKIIKITGHYMRPPSVIKHVFSVGARTAVLGRDHPDLPNVHFVFRTSGFFLVPIVRAWTIAYFQFRKKKWN